jgi:hypothetical protein
MAPFVGPSRRKLIGIIANNTSANVRMQIGFGEPTHELTLSEGKWALHKVSFHDEPITDPSDGRLYVSRETRGCIMQRGDELISTDEKAVLIAFIEKWDYAPWNTR